MFGNWDVTFCVNRNETRDICQTAITPPSSLNKTFEVADNATRQRTSNLGQILVRTKGSAGIDNLTLYSDWESNLRFKVRCGMLTFLPILQIFADKNCQLLTKKLKSFNLKNILLYQQIFYTDRPSCKSNMILEKLTLAIFLFFLSITIQGNTENLFETHKLSKSPIIGHIPRQKQNF